MTVVEPPVSVDDLSRVLKDAEKKIPRLLERLAAQPVRSVSIDFTPPPGTWLDGTEIARLDRELAEGIAGHVAALGGDSSGQRRERLERVLVLLEREAASLRALGERAAHESRVLLQRSELAVYEGDDSSTRKLLESHSERREESERRLGEAEQLEWLVTAYKEALSAAGAPAPGSRRRA